MPVLCEEALMIQYLLLVIIYIEYIEKTLKENTLLLRKS